jgi:putative solute:sodium symporter small subunit
MFLWKVFVAALVQQRDQMGAKMADLEQHWAETRGLTTWILILWFIVSIGIVFFANALNSVTFFGWPFGFYMAAQGSLMIFVILIVVLNFKQEKIDEKFGVAEDE